MLVDMSHLKKWKLLATEDVSPSRWFPLEKRTYQRPDGIVVDDFYVTTLEDVAMIVPITSEGTVVLIRMYKQGSDEIMWQFPAGRLESKHADIQDLAIRELEEETGIRVTADSMHLIGKQLTMGTKASEVCSVYLVKDCVFNSEQQLDDNEEIEVGVFAPKEIDEMILSGELWCAPSISAWTQVRLRERFDQ